MLSLASNGVRFFLICCLLTHCQEWEGTNRLKDREKEEIYMDSHDCAAGRTPKQGAGEQNTKKKKVLKSNKLMLHPSDGHKVKEKIGLHILFHCPNTYEAHIILEQIKC